MFEMEWHCLASCPVYHVHRDLNDHLLCTRIVASYSKGAEERFLAFFAFLLRHHTDGAEASTVNSWVLY
jgi:hypothetical protein